MKKIVFLIDNLKGGGAEKAIKIIIEGLTQQDVKPILILLENQQDYHLNEDVEVHSLSKKTNKYNFIFLLWKLSKLLNTINPDIVFATNTMSQVLVLFSKPFNRAKRIINFQADLSKHYENRKYSFFFFSKVLLLSDGYCFISKGIYNNLQGKIPDKEIFFVPNPIDFNEIDTLQDEPIEEQYAHIFNKKVIINIGRLTAQKGQWILLEAFSKIQDDYNMIILGVGEKEQELKKLAEKLNIADRVFFIGFQRNPFKFLKNSHIFVLSSLFEGFGNVIVEAMRCGLPIISTDCPSGPGEILSLTYSSKNNNHLQKTDFGILVQTNHAENLSKAMHLLLKDELLLQHYRQQSLIRSETYKEDKIITQFINQLLK